MSEQFGRRYGNGHYLHRVRIQMREYQDYAKIVNWLVRNIGGCEKLPRVFERNMSVSELDAISGFLNVDPPLWAIKHYNNCTAKFYFRDRDKAALFKLAWAGHIVKEV